MAKPTKPELTWAGKRKRGRLKTPALVEDGAHSYRAAPREGEREHFDNRLVYGDNLPALLALEAEFAGRIKCAYIDPPFNTGQSLEHYDDSAEHSLWLTLMRDRIEVIYRLLAADGLLWVHLDDTEVHYCKVLLDEIFGRSRFVSHVTYERSGSAGLGQGGVLVNTAEHILFYRKGELAGGNLYGLQKLELKTMKRYAKFLASEGQRRLVREFRAKSNGETVSIYEHADFRIEKISLRNYEQRREQVLAEFVDNFERLFRVSNVQRENGFQNELISSMNKSSLYTVDYIPNRGKKKGVLTTLYYFHGELFAWLKDSAVLQNGEILKSNKLTDVWSHAEIPKADLASEGGVDFPRGKKPEQLLRRILDISTREGDWVLDAFAGSGTTGAAAHKMRRRWILVESGEHLYTHIIPRLKSVIDGTERSGITQETGWTGGGGFRCLRLAPTQEDLGK